MKPLERVLSSIDIKIIIGSAFLWSWVDALFMSVFFVAPGSKGFMAEAATIAVFGVGALATSFALVNHKIAGSLLTKKRSLLSAAALGSAGSLLFVAAGIGGNWFLMLAGAVCAGVFIATYQVSWGAAYCHDGARSGALYAAGGFACAVLVDVPLLLMVPEASAVFFALLPLVTGFVFLAVDPQRRTFRPGLDGVSARARGLMPYLKTYLGISVLLIGAVVLVMVGFGYVQHLISFSPMMETQVVGGVSTQVARGGAAVLMFVIVVAFPWCTSMMYRVGLLIMIAGFMGMPFLFGTDLFWVSGAIIISGYTAFDLLLWAITSQIAATQSRSPLKTVAVMRLIALLCYAVGAVVGIVLLGDGAQGNRFASAETTLVGYLVVIATVLIMSSEDIWVLFGRSQFAELSGSSDQAGFDLLLEERFEQFALTAREKEVAALLAYGRTKPWIAERLMISENTVGTHVRNIYKKMKVHDRQEYIDIVLSPSSSETGDTQHGLTKID